MVSVKAQKVFPLVFPVPTLFLLPLTFLIIISAAVPGVDVERTDNKTSLSFSKLEFHSIMNIVLYWGYPDNWYSVFLTFFAYLTLSLPNVTLGLYLYPPVT